MGRRKGVGRQSPSGPPRSSRRIYVVGFLDATGLGMYLAFAAVYLSQVVSMSNYGVGLVLGAGGLTSLFGAIPIARLADRWGFRRSLTVLFVARAISFAALACAVDLWTAVLAAAFGGLLNRGIRPLIQAALISGLDNAGAVGPLARLRALRNAGMAIGALPSGVAISAGEERIYRSIMGAAAFLFVVCALASLSLASDDGKRTGTRAEETPGLVRNGPFLHVTVVYSALMLSTILLGTGMALWIVQRTNAPPWTVTMSYILNTVLVVALQGPLSRSSESPHRARSMMIAGGALAAAGAAVVPLSAFGHGWVPVAVIVLVVVLLTGGEIYVVAGATSLALVHTPQEDRSAYLATFNLGFGAATVVGPTLIGVSLGLNTVGWLAWAVLFALVAVACRAVPLQAGDRTAPETRPGHKQTADNDTVRNVSEKRMT